MHITVLYLGIFGIYSSAYVYQIDRGTYPDDMQHIQCMNPVYCLDIYCRVYTRVQAWVIEYMQVPFIEIQHSIY